MQVAHRAAPAALVPGRKGYACGVAMQSVAAARGSALELLRTLAN